MQLLDTSSHTFPTRAFLAACAIHVLVLVLCLLQVSEKPVSLNQAPTIVQAELVDLARTPPPAAAPKPAPKVKKIEAPKPTPKPSVAPPPKPNAIPLEKPKPKLKPAPVVKIEKSAPVKKEAPPKKEVKKVAEKKPAPTPPKPVPAKPKPAPTTKPIVDTKAQKIKALEEAQLQKQLDAESEQISAERTQYIHEEVDKYKIQILQSISQQWIVPPNVTTRGACQLLIRLDAKGLVLNVRLLTSSGNDSLDQSAIQAVYKASPLPVPTDADVFDAFRELNLTVKPGG